MCVCVTVHPRPALPTFAALHHHAPFAAISLANVDVPVFVVSQRARERNHAAIMANFQVLIFALAVRDELSCLRIKVVPETQ